MLGKGNNLKKKIIVSDLACDTIKDVGVDSIDKLKVK